MPPPELVRLVERFERNLDDYRQGRYKETQVRLEFVDPLFKLLGWDVHNEQGRAEAYKDVVHEATVKVGADTRAPDYCFRVGGTRKFFVEAKKPSVDLKHAVDPAYQLRRYAWSAKLPVGILTDFEELAVYDCRARPHPRDKASKGRIKYWTFRQYPDEWDEIESVLSREAVLRGDFDRFVGSAKKKRGTAEVDDAFLEDIELWREMLAKDIARRNDLGVRELNFSVQRTIDRIIFLRICEDRGVESYGRLRSLQNGSDIYGRLFVLFRDADRRYNSGLFHFETERDREPPDDLTPDIEIDDAPLREIIRGLYYPESPYEFSVLPADILGQVYERFLGSVIRRTPKGAKVEPKPEVRKAGGVYYTPTYIVDYIVRNTVGKLLEGGTPKKAEKLRILDPACGSGSFLLGAYQYLLDWHLEYYAKHAPAKWARKPRGKGRYARIFRDSRGEWRLTASERKRILLANIHGVDIDTQAVEVTKLSLLLKVLEGATSELVDVLLFHKERALPDLGSNVKCGNSLIGPDYFDGRLEVDDEERMRVNAFEWEREFADIFKGKNPGFDAVIGNPPYVRQEALADVKAYLQRRYEAWHSMADLCVYFIERGTKLIRAGGLFSVIVSSSFLRTSYALPLRRYLRQRTAVVELVDFGGLAVFENAKDTYVCIPLVARQGQPESVNIAKVPSLRDVDLPAYVSEHSYLVPAARLKEEGWSVESQAHARTFEKLKASGTALGRFLDGRIFYGIKTGLNEAFVVDAATRKAIVQRSPRCKRIIRRFVGGQDIRRYFVRDTGRFLIAIPSGWTVRQICGSDSPRLAVSESEAWNWLQTNYPPVAEHLSHFMKAAKRRQDMGRFWWELRPCDYYHVLDGPKIIYPDIAKGPRFFLDVEGRYITNTAYCLGTSDLYLLGLLNSRLAWFAVGSVSIPFGTRAGQFRYRLIYQYMEQLPIRVIDFSKPEDKKRHDRMVSLVRRMLDLNKKLPKAKTPHARELLERDIAATDRRIDQLVYELYGLTEKEIGIVEGAAGNPRR